MLNILGIDLGTTRIVAAIMKKDSPVIVPPPVGEAQRLSVVAFDPAGQPLVGRSAYQQARGNPANTVYAAKRLLGRRIDDPAVRRIAETVSYDIVPGPEREASIYVPATNTAYTPPEILAEPLRELRHDAKAHFGETVDTALMTTPTCFNDTQRLAIAAAGQLAGFDVLGIMDDPLAAALAYSMKHKRDQTLLIFDLGGGTLSISVLSFKNGLITVRASGGDPVLGGDDWDNRLAGWLVRKFKLDTKIDLRRDPRAMQRLRQAAEMAKIELSTATEAEIELPFISADSCGPKHLKFKLTRHQFEQLTEDLATRCTAMVENVLQEAGMTGEALDHILLTGGAARMPMIQERLRDLTGTRAEPYLLPDDAVALGAAIQAWQMGTNIARNLSEFVDTLLNNSFKPQPESHKTDLKTKRSEQPKTRGTNSAVQISLDEAFAGTTRFLQSADGNLVEARIPPGVQDGWQFKLTGQRKSDAGDQSSQDLCFTIEVKPDPTFERVDDNLRVTVLLELYTALLGGEVEVATIDRTVKLHIPAGTTHGTIFRLRGLGMPHLNNPCQRGDLFARVELQLPKDLGQDEKELLQKWQAIRKKSPTDSSHGHDKSI